MLAIFAIIISVIAAFISFISLWKGYFAPFKLSVATGMLKLRIYPVKNGSNKWYIGLLVTPITFANVSAKKGKVLGLRITAQFPDLNIPNAREIFTWYGEIDRQKYEKDAQHIFKWQQTSTLSGDEPFILLPNSSSSKYMAFKTRWDFPIEAKNIVYTLQTYTDPRKRWKDVETWKMQLTPMYWSELTENQTSIGVSPSSAPREERIPIPKDLHRLLKIKGKIPKGGFQAAPTYLDYPVNQDDKKIAG